MALKDNDLFVVRDSADGDNKKVLASALQTYVTGGANVQAVEGGAGVTATDVAGTVTVVADINQNRGLEFTGAGDTRQIAVALGDGLGFDANGAIEVTNQALNFAGNVDLTNPGTIPAGQVEVGDAYVNTGNGAADAAWAAITTDLATADPVVGSDLVVCTTAGVGNAAVYVFIHTGGGGGGVQSVNLAEGNPTLTTVDVVNDAGDDATLTAAVAGVRAGLLTSADKTKLDGITLDANGNVNEVEVNLTRARTATTNTVECDAGTDALLTAAEPSVNGAGGFAGLLVATDKEKLDGVGEGAAVVSVTAGQALSNAGTATEVVLNVDFGAVSAGNTPETVMPYDISMLPDI
jgi:hypothetical protein